MAHTYVFRVSPYLPTGNLKLLSGYGIKLFKVILMPMVIFMILFKMILTSRLIVNS
jgi:hypothetical protein